MSDDDYIARLKQGMAALRELCAEGAKSGISVKFRSGASDWFEGVGAAGDFPVAVTKVLMQPPKQDRREGVTGYGD